MRVNLAIVPPMPSGTSVDGEAPGWAARDPDPEDPGTGLEPDRRLSVTASPSMPAATGPSASTVKVGVLHWRQGEPRGSRAAPALRR